MTEPNPTFAERIGLGRFLRDLHAQRRRYRQFIGIAFLILLTILGTPRADWFFIGVGFAAVGLLIRLWASGYVLKDKELATTGAYAFVRHPLYVGNHLVTLGFCLASGLWWSFLVWLALLVFFYPQTIRDEDALLSRLFPEQWAAWSREVHAQIPRLTPFQGQWRGQWSLTLSLKRNGEPIIVAVLAGCLYFLYTRLP